MQKSKELNTKMGNYKCKMLLPQYKHFWKTNFGFMFQNI